MKNNFQNLSKNKGITLIEITLVIALILGLTAVGAFGLAAYKKGSSAANCLAQQQRILKTTIGALMHGIDNADEVGTNEQRYTIINEFYTAIQPAIRLTSEIKCPSFNTKPSRDEVIKHRFGAKDEAQFELWYGTSLDTVILKWCGFPSIEAGLEEFGKQIAQYNVGYSMYYNSDNSSSWVKNYGLICKQISKTSYIYIGCPKSWSSYGVTQNAKNKIEYHTNW